STPLDASSRAARSANRSSLLAGSKLSFGDVMIYVILNNAFTAVSSKSSISYYRTAPTLAHALWLGNRAACRALRANFISSPLTNSPGVPSGHAFTFSRVPRIDQTGFRPSAITTSSRAAFLFSFLSLTTSIFLCWPSLVAGGFAADTPITGCVRSAFYSMQVAVDRRLY
ncbi:hypothetical protein, partial [Burkholderia ubonensis]|uniref:hypothetical protein n=1 Tax=Burkholderia ubonensis TaxID=101571 RepID=UPI001E3E5544